MPDALVNHVMHDACCDLIWLTCCTLLLLLSATIDKRFEMVPAVVHPQHISISSLPPFSTGCFGEGMKVEINRLVSHDVNVSIVTGARRWHFQHEAAEAEGCQGKILHVYTYPADPCRHTSMVLMGPRDQLAPVDPALFLFLQPMDSGAPMDPANRCSSQKLEVLLNKQHEGNVYVRGILVQHLEGLKGLGLNFIGAHTEYASISFGRDRNSCDVSRLIGWVPETVEECRRTSPAHHRLLVGRIYDALNEQERNSPTRVLGSNLVSRCKYRSDPEEMALCDALVEVFCTRHKTQQGGGYIFPVDRAQNHDATKHEARYLGCTPVPVSSDLFGCLQVSRNCPSLDKYWAHLEDEVDSVPNWQPASQEQVAIASRYLAVAYEWYSPYLKPGQVIFKSFPPGNTHVAMLGKKRGSGERFYAVDITLLEDVAKTHEYILRTYNEPCSDVQSGGMCGGACTMLRYADALLDVLVKSGGVLRELERRQKTAMMRMQTRDLPNVPVPAPAPPPQGPSPHDTAGTSQGEPVSSPPSGTETSTLGTENDAPTGPRSPPETIPEPRRGTAGSFMEGVKSSIRRCLEGSLEGGAERQVPDSIRAAAQCGGLPAGICYTEGKTELDLVKLDDYNGRVHFYHEGRDAHDARRLGCDDPVRRTSMRALAYVMEELAGNVFKTPMRLRVFWEDRERIAFNKGGDIFFNVLYALQGNHLVVQESRGSSSVMINPSCFIFWFVTFCHELAHNTAHGHDKAHEAAEENLLVVHMAHLGQYMAGKNVGSKPTIFPVGT
eukprot:jgi/Mesvir1/17221/Mv07635-RA.1